MWEALSEGSEQTGQKASVGRIMVFARRAVRL
jgi:hypothetical protein